MKNIVRVVLTIIVGTILFSCGVSIDYSKPHQVETKKREIRAAWIPTIYRDDYKDLPLIEAKQKLSKRLKALSDAGFNMIFFQARTEGDSWYNSQIEPSSRFLTSKSKDGGRCEWDPLAFVISEGHKYGMEVHAWINPYRAWANTDIKIPYNHAARLHPDWVIKYGKQLYFDPGNPDYRVYLLGLLKDMMLRYDIDGIHFDDYFYPYPKDGVTFNDDDSFIKYGISVGYKYEDKDIWRRYNVNLFIDQLHELVSKSKPWLRISVSPFGIYRNEKTSSDGSNTNGLQCYDDLYADVIKWVNEGWVDYIVPQIYWNFGDKRADYGELVKWWSKATKHKATLIIGQNVSNTMNSDQLYPKWLMSSEYSKGNCWWSSEDIWNNYKSITDSLTNNYQRTKALLPQIKGRLGKTKQPEPITSLMEDVNEDGHMIIWEDVKDPDDPEKPFMYAIYAIPEGYRAVTSEIHLVSLTSIPHFILPSMGQQKKYTFMITTINRFWQESIPMEINVVL